MKRSTRRNRVRLFRMSNSNGLTSAYRRRHVRNENKHVVRRSFLYFNDDFIVLFERSLAKTKGFFFVAYRSKRSPEYIKRSTTRRRTPSRKILNEWIKKRKNHLGVITTPYPLSRLLPRLNCLSMRRVMDQQLKVGLTKQLRTFRTTRRS